jgi:TATA-box binding protein (TBP) (component of TFIID and TFIIIB)
MTEAVRDEELERVFPKKQNMVCTVNTRTQFDLKDVALKTFSEYNPAKFAAVVMRLWIRATMATALVFESGNIVCTGTKTRELALLAVHQFVQKLCECGYSAEVSDFRVVNIVSSTNVGFPIDLTMVHYDHGVETVYVPELFPGLIYRNEVQRVAKTAENVRAAMNCESMLSALSVGGTMGVGGDPHGTGKPIWKSAGNGGKKRGSRNASRGGGSSATKKPPVPGTEMTPAATAAAAEAAAALAAASVAGNDDGTEYRVVVLAFETGKIVITGAKVDEDIRTAFYHIYPLLRNCRKDSGRNLATGGGGMHRTRTTQSALEFNNMLHRQHNLNWAHDREISEAGFAKGVGVGIGSLPESFVGQSRSKIGIDDAASAAAASGTESECDPDSTIPTVSGRHLGSHAVRAPMQAAAAAASQIRSVATANIVRHTNPGPYSTFRIDPIRAALVGGKRLSGSQDEIETIRELAAAAAAADSDDDDDDDAEGRGGGAVPAKPPVPTISACKRKRAAATRPAPTMTMQQSLLGMADRIARGGDLPSAAQQPRGLEILPDGGAAAAAKKRRKQKPTWDEKGKGPAAKTSDSKAGHSILCDSLLDSARGGLFAHPSLVQS